MSLQTAVMLDTYGESASPTEFKRTATVAERQGFDALLVGDHVAFPEADPDNYPFSPDGTPPAMYDADSDCYDPFEVLSFVAGITEQLRLGTNMCVAPLRHPVTLTKLVFTLDALSEGRVELGVAVGWLQAEFEVLDIPFDERGPRTTEFLDLFEAACRDPLVEFEGTYHSIRSTGFHPRPVQDGGPPIWIGGTSGAALRRLGRYGDGVVTVWDRPEEVETLRERMRRAWNDHQREGEPQIAVMRPTRIDSTADDDKPLVGTADDVVADLQEYAAAGADRVVLDFFTESPAAKREQMVTFGEEVLPRL